ncbi:hypothetical protein [Lacticaseibacillus yichunensis]|uniref:hypothetical protein n=1 Tax=Lacticaseibacillus yichunensis TaxID=2486015 RepID=UPI0013DE7753|nr:hypothetical protein [Lacticaseibacillus yichunensis]
MSELVRWATLLLLNLLFCAIAFTHQPGYGNADASFAKNTDWPWMAWQYGHQLLAIIIAIVILSCLAGILAVGIANLGLLLQNRYYTAFVSLAAWIIISTGNSTVLSGLQPFVEYNVAGVLIHLGITCAVIFLVSLIAGYQEAHGDLL